MSFSRLSYFSLLVAVPLVLAARPTYSETVVQVVSTPNDRASIAERVAELQGDGVLAAVPSTRGLASQTFVIPRFTFDALQAGNSTLYALRNPSTFDNQVAVGYFTASGDLQTFENFVLGSRQTTTRNVRDVAGIDDVDPDGFARGYAIITMDSGGAADYFQVNSDEDFASGDLIPNVDEFCSIATARLLKFFAGDEGTVLTLLMDQVFGSDPNTDPPSAVLTFYSEGGVELGTVNVFADTFIVDLGLSDLASNFGVNFGTVDIDIVDPDGGLATVSHSAFNRFSVGHLTECFLPAIGDL